MLVDPNKSVIFFDGICNLCNASVQFIIKRDKDDSFRFATVQSKIGQQLIANFSTQNNQESVLLFENGKLYSESTAALRISRKLSGIWPMLFILVIIPPPIRNSIYRLIAKNRYRWFGRKERCMIPTGDLAHKFLL